MIEKIMLLFGWRIDPESWSTTHKWVHKNHLMIHCSLKQAIATSIKKRRWLYDRKTNRN
jgi:hypothetical protein